MLRCTQCGEEVRSDWRYCLECGAPVQARVAIGASNGGGSTNGAATNGSTPATGDPAEAKTDWSAKPRTAKARRLSMPSTRSLVTGLVAFVVLLAFVLGAAKLQNVSGQLSRNRADLASTRQDLANTQDDLASTESDLSDMTDLRDQLQTENQDLQSKIDGLQGSLTDARDQVNLQASQITVLKTCLQGVSIALNDVVNMDYAGAVSALDAVRAPCNEAARLL